MYKEFACVYDLLMSDENAVEWTDYLEAVFSKYKAQPKLLLDLACGTGEVSIECAKRGYEVIGIDISEDMLSIAKDKSEKVSQDILFLNQDMCNFELYGTVDAIFCFVDGINYITNKNKLQKLFKLVNNYLNTNGLFIFDIRSHYAFSELGGNDIYFSERENISYIIKNNYDRKSKLCEMDVTFFVGENKLYKKFVEKHLLREYDVVEISEYLNKAGMQFLGAYDKLSFKKIKNTTERIMIISKKV